MLEQWSIGSIHGCYKVVESTNSYSVKVTCIYCGDTRVIGKSNLRRKDSCRNRNCSKYIKINRDNLVKWKIGNVYGCYKLLNKYDIDKIQVKCIYCGEVRNTTLNTLRRSPISCSNPNCEACSLNVNQFSIGKTYNDLYVISYSEEDRKYLVRCTKCKCKFYTRSYVFIKERGYCKNINCDNYYRRRDSEYLVGLERNTLKCIGYVDGNKIRLKCTKCGLEFTYSNKEIFYNGDLYCSNIKCSGGNSNRRIKNKIQYENRLENRFRYVDIIKSVNTKTLLVKCKKCGTQFEAEKISSKDSVCKCPNVDCVYNNIRLVKCLGNCYGDYVVDNIIDKDKIVLRCIICGNTIIVNKILEDKKICRMHPHRKPRCVDIFNNIQIISFEFMYKDLEYFMCKCQKCGKKDILNVKQMLEHRCQD